MTPADLNDPRSWINVYNEQRNDRGGFEMSENVLMTSAQLKKLIPVTDMTLWRWMERGIFPRPKKINRRNYWKLVEVQAWMDGQGRA